MKVRRQPSGAQRVINDVTADEVDVGLSLLADIAHELWEIRRLLSNLNINTDTPTHIPQLKPLANNDDLPF